jgi:hypothetical protein
MAQPSVDQVVLTCMNRFLIAACVCCLAVPLLGQTGSLIALRHTSSGLALTATTLDPFAVTPLTPNAITSDAYPSGVADLDCFADRFFYVRGIPQRLVTADATTGALLHHVTVANPLDASVRLSNIAYDWTDDRVIGTAAVSGTLNQTNLYLIEVEPATGAVTVLSESPAVGAYHGSGNCDLDAAGNRYFLLGSYRLYTWDALTGELLSTEVLPNLDPTASGQSLTHLAYHPLENALYALHKREPDEYNPWGPPFQSEMRLVRKALPDGDWSFVSGEVLSMDGIQSGGCDLDPFNNRFIYIQDDQIRVVDAATGLLTASYDAPGGDVISEWANVQYHDLSTPVVAAIEVADTIWVEWDGVSPLALEHGLGGMLEGDWADGGPGEALADGTWAVNGYGGLDWSGWRMGASGRGIEVTQHYEVIPAVSPVGVAEIEPAGSWRVFPNPGRPGEVVRVSGDEATGGSWTLRSLADGRVVARGTLQVPSDAAPGLYVWEKGGSRSAPFLVSEW